MNPQMSDCLEKSDNEENTSDLPHLDEVNLYDVIHLNNEYDSDDEFDAIRSIN